MPLPRVTAAAILAACAAAAQAAPPSLENKIAQCQGCHGIADWKTAFPEVYRVPKLGGQKAAYIVAALKAYRSGERDFPTMRAIAADLTDQDMEQLAKYYGSDAGAATAAAPAPAAPAGTPAAATPAPATPAPGAGAVQAPLQSTAPAATAPAKPTSPAKKN